MPHYPKPFFRQSRQLWYVQLDGKQLNLGPDREAAFQRYHELMAQPKQQTPPPTAGTPLVALCDRFLEWLQQNRSAATYEWYRCRLQAFVRKYPKLTADRLRPFHVQEWVDRQQIAAATRRNAIRAVKRCLKWARQQGYIEVNPVAELEAPSAQRREMVVTAGEYRDILANISDPAFRDLVVTTWETGCRPQESLRVEVRHVDLANQRWVFPVAESKTRRASRVVYLSDAALEITARRVAAYRSGRLFRNSQGKPWTNYAVQCAFRRVRIRLGRAEMQRQGIEVSEREIHALLPLLSRTRMCRGVAVAKSTSELRTEAKRKATQRRAIRMVPRYSLYALRHSWATRALQRGLDSLTVAILMGHQDPSMLARVYQHLSMNPQHLLSEVRRMAG